MITDFGPILVSVFILSLLGAISYLDHKQKKLATAGTSKSFQFHCPHCHGRIEFELAHVGEIHPCPYCQEAIVMEPLEVRRKRLKHLKSIERVRAKPATRTTPKEGASSFMVCLGIGTFWIVFFGVLSLLFGWAAIFGVVISVFKILLTLLTGSLLISMSVGFALEVFRKSAEITRSATLSAIIFLMWLGALFMISYRVFRWIGEAFGNEKAQHASKITLKERVA